MVFVLCENDIELTNCGTCCQDYRWVKGIILDAFPFPCFEVTKHLLHVICHNCQNYILCIFPANTLFLQVMLHLNTSWYVCYVLLREWRNWVNNKMQLCLCPVINHARKTDCFKMRMKTICTQVFGAVLFQWIPRNRTENSTNLTKEIAMYAA